MAELIREGRKIKMVFGVEDIYHNTANFKDHRQYIEWFFEKHNLKITKWNWERNPLSGKWFKNEDGIEFKSTDRQVDLHIEVLGELGVNVREINAT